MLVVAGLVVVSIAKAAGLVVVSTAVASELMAAVTGGFCYSRV